MNHKKQETKTYQRYGIRKFSQGVASVMIASGMFFLGGGSVSANEVVADQQETKVTEEAVPSDETDQVEEATAKKAVDTDKLTEAMAILQSNIEGAKETDSTRSALANANTAMEEAEALLKNENATQEQVDKALANVRSHNFVVSTMPKVDAVEKEVTQGENSITNTGSYDPRNGQSLGEAGDALRANVTGTSTTDTTDNGTHIVTTNDDVPLDQETKDAIDQLKQGEGVGVLVDKTQTVTPDMQDPNGASLKDPKSPIPNTSPTSNEDYHTFGYFGLDWLDFAGVDYGLPKDYYMRASTNKDSSKSDVLLEMVKFSDNSVVETHTVDPTKVVDFSSLEKVAEGTAKTNYLSKYYPIKALFDTTARDESKNIAGQIILYFAQVANGWSMGSYNIPLDTAFVTKYVTDDGKLLATYSIKGSSKQMYTPSNEREFSGYTFKETQVSGTPKLNVYNIDAPAVDAKNYQYKRLLEMVKADGTAVKSVWIVDPTLSADEKSKLNFSDESTDGFIKVLETSEMEPGGVNSNIKVVTGQKLSDGTILISDEEAAEIESKADDNDGVNFGANNTIKIWEDPNDDKRYIRLGFVGNYTNVRPYGIAVPGKSAYMQTTWAPQTNFKLVPLENDALYVPTILHVYTKAGEVVVKYVDQDGKELSGTGLTSIDATSGTTITSAGQVAVAKTQLTDTAIPYNTTTETLKPSIIKSDDGTIYYLVGLDADQSVYDNNTTNTTTDDVKVGETGTVQQGTTTITYQYQKAGSVTIHYIATDGTVLQDPIKDVENGKPGTLYDATENSDSKEERPTVLSKGGKVYRLVQTAGETTTGITYDEKGLATGTGYAPATGKVESGVDKNVTFVYEEVVGSVQVKYIDEAGNPIEGVTTGITKPSVQSTEADVNANGEAVTNVAVGTKYDTTDLRPSKITTVDGKVYEIVLSLTKGNETGEVTEGMTTVTYVYREVKSNVVVHYVDTEGKALSGTTTGIAKAAVGTSETDVTNASVGTNYDTTDLRPSTITTTDGTVYYYKDLATNSAAESGKVAETTTTVTYVYEKAANVVVKYEIAGGSELTGELTFDDAKTKITVPITGLADETNVKPGSAYDTTDHKPTKITTADGKVYYLVGLDEDKTFYDNNTSSNTADDVKVGEIGTAKSGTTTVTYQYQQAGSVVVNYTLADGTVIKEQAKPTEYTNAKPGVAYTTATEILKPTTITTKDGKTYKLVPSETKGNETGTITSGETTQVTYVYEEVKGNVVVENYDTKGNKLGDTVSVKTDVSTGTSYTTTPEDKLEVNGKTYYYKEVKSDSAPESGKVTEGTTTVKYVYEEAGSVTVNYVDKDGNSIKTPVKDVENGKPGDKYDTTDNKPTTITTADGKTYKLVPSETKGNETGTITSGENTQVTYVYEEVKTSYVDKNGKEIPGYRTEDGEQSKKKIPGYRYVETKKLPNGDIEHVYEKVTTSYITEDGKEIPGYPTEDGEQPKKDIPGYEFVRTEVDSDGNITHVYKPVTMPTTPAQLPNTGVAGSTGVLGAAAAAIMAGLGIALPKKKKDDNE